MRIGRKKDETSNVGEGGGKGSVEGEGRGTNRGPKAKTSGADAEGELAKGGRRRARRGGE
jgi:hypothetical protein